MNLPHEELTPAEFEAFLAEQEAKTQANTLDTIKKIDELVAEVLKTYYPEDIFTPTTADDKEKFNAINPNAHTRIHCDGIRHGLHQLRRMARDLSPKEDLEVYKL